MLVSDVEIFLKKTKKEEKNKASLNMVVNDIRIFLSRMKMEKLFLQCRKQRLAEHFLLYLPQVGLQSIKKNLGKYKKFVQGGIFQKKYQNFFQGRFFLLFRAWPGNCPRLLPFPLLKQSQALGQLIRIKAQNCKLKQI